jgi:hypothetical protein
MTNPTNAIHIAREGFIANIKIDKPSINRVSMFGLAPRARM